MHIGKNIKPITMKKQSSLTSTTSVPAIDTQSFGRVFLIKGNTLSVAPEMPESESPAQRNFKSAHEFERFVTLNWEPVFGERTIGIGANAEGLSFPWDAFLFDFSAAKPRCYLLMVGMSREPFEKFFWAISRAFGYLRNPDFTRILIDVLTNNIVKDKRVCKGFQRYIGETPITEFIEEIIPRGKVLFITDKDRPQYPDFALAYPETWDALLSVIYLRKYQVGKLQMLSMHPSLADFQEKPQVKEIKEKVIHTEDHHFAKSAATVRVLYDKLKKEAVKIDKSVAFNPNGGHYISMKKNGGKNLAFFHFRKTTIYLVVKLDEKIVRKMVKKAEIKTLPPSVQKFWNGASTGLVFSTTDHLKEMTEVLKKLIKQ